MEYGIDTSIMPILQGNGTALDYGCGTGEMTRTLLRKGYRVIAVDTDPTCQDVIRRGLSDDEDSWLTFMKKDAFLDRQSGDKPLMFDLVLCREVLEHISDWPEIVASFGRWQNVGGLLIVSIPTAVSENIFTWMDPKWLKKSKHVTVIERKELLFHLGSCGFRTMREHGAGFRWSLLWVMLAPLHFEHEMGNPLHTTRCWRLARAISNFACRLPLIDRIGNQVLPKSYVVYAKKSKPRILIAYDFLDWILGRWACNIRQLFADEFDVIALSMYHYDLDQRFVSEIVRTVDIIHVLLPHCFETFRSLSPDTTIVGTIHHWIDWTPSYAMVAAQSNYLVAVSNVWRDRLIQKGVPAERITVVRSGFDERLLEIERIQRSASSKLAIGFFAKAGSNESDRKGTAHFRAVLRRLAERELGDEFRIVICGPGWRDYASDLSKTGIEIVYLDYVEAGSMWQVYQSIDVYLMLSDVEGGPATICEALASQCMVLSTRVGVALDVIEDGVTGMFVDAHATDEVVDKLVFIKANPKMIAHIATSGRRFASEHLRYETTLAPLRQVYRDVLACAGRPGRGDVDTAKINSYCDRTARTVGRID